MAREVYAREESSKQQVQRLQIKIDDMKKDRQVAEIAQTEYFRSLRNKADQLRDRHSAADQ